MPPGGPEDHVAPKLVSVSPDTNATNVKASSVTFRFDEVVSERPGAASSLDKLVVLSPSDGAARIRWRRSRIQVRPRRSFRPNTTYTVTLLPGIADLRGNVHTTPFTTTFSTGPELSCTWLRGVVFDWVAGKPATRAFVQAWQRSDTTFTWLAQADSAGRFELRSFPSGSYLVRAIIDANDNRGLDPREAWDTVGVAVADSGHLELYAFVHDTIGPRINAATVADSVTLRVEFDKAISPTPPLTPAQFVNLASDSTPTAVLALPSDSTLEAERDAREKARTDSLHAPKNAKDSAQADSTRRTRAVSPVNPTDSRVPLPRPGRGRPVAPVDTVPLPKPTRPSPITHVNLRLARPLKPATTYRLRAIDIRGLLGNARTSDKLFTTPKPPPPPAPDSLRPPAVPARPSADSLRTPARPTSIDSLRRVPPTAAPPVKP
jgi:hypothetical protein